MGENQSWRFKQYIRTLTIAMPVSPSLHSLDRDACRTRHVTVLPDRVVPTIIVLCREFLVSYSWITLMTVSGRGCSVLSLSSVSTACFNCTKKSTTHLRTEITNWSFTATYPTWMQWFATVATIGHQLRTIQVTTENTSSWELVNNGTQWLSAYLRLTS